MIQSAAPSSARTDDAKAAVRSRDHVAWLGAVLEAIALEALARETPRWLDPPEGRRIGWVIGQPVAEATHAAIDRLEAELARALERGPDLHRRADDERRRAEFGLD